VSSTRDTAADVGDEALLLVDAAPVWVARSRPLGAQAAIDTGADVIVMDDGFQNPLIYKDFSFIVVDGAAGFGNGKVFPAGPLRESISFGLSRADAVVIIGDDKTGARQEIERRTALPIFQASVRPVADNPELFGKPVYAFAGIGRPAKFRDTLIAAGAMVEGWAEFPDHFPYELDDLKELIAAAEEKQALIVTTAKDHVRLPPSLKEKVKAFRITLHWQNQEEVATALLEALRARMR
jgi:tetraacyldisaccharide 4'-kinase